MSLEAALVLPVVALVAWTLLQAAGVFVDALRLHDAARAGVRVAVTSHDDRDVSRIVAAVLPAVARDLDVSVDPALRRPGDLVIVEVRLLRTVGPLQHDLVARSAGVAEPILGMNQVAARGG
ncbi:MAG: TadE/TadG family type IV pilus assembly protein [Nitriliruptoraceae bacterium]